MGNEQKFKNIQEKIIEAKKETPNLEEKIRNLYRINIEEFISILTDSKSFKQKFLIPHYKMYNILHEINSKIFELRNMYLSEEQIKDYLPYFHKKKLELAESKLEIYFCNALSGDRKFLKALANVVMPFGMTHTGILVDDICIQWGRGLLGQSLIHPSIHAKYNDFIYIIELRNITIWNLIKETFDNLTEYITGKKNYDYMGTIKAFNICSDQLDIISEICVDYNLNKTYHIVFENCQHFVTKIIKRLQLEVIQNGEVGRVMKIVEEVCDPIDFIYNGIKFNTRRELDEYVLQIDFKLLPEDHRKNLFHFRDVFEYHLRNKPYDKKYQTSDLAKEYWSELSNSEKFE